MSARFMGSAAEFLRKARTLADSVRSGAAEALEEPARTLVREMDEATPPRNQGAGEGKIAKDILAVLKGVPGAGEAPGPAHRAARDSAGQTRPPAAKIPVNRARLQAYLKRQTRKAGRAKASLNVAKRALGLPVPGWLARHGDTKGNFRRMSQAGTFSVVVEMGSPYASRIRTLSGSLEGIRSRARAQLRASARAMVAGAKRSAGFD